VSGSPFSLEGKRILVTGAASGIGAATARLCARMGARVIVCGSDRAALDEVLASLEGSGHDAVCVDLIGASGRQSLVEAVHVLDGCVFSGGADSVAPLENVSQAGIDTVFSRNFDVPVLLTQALSAGQKIGPGASLVYVTSVAQHCAFGGAALHAGSNAALSAAVRAIAVEYAPHGVRANCVSPGSAGPALEGAKEAAPLGPVEPEDVAASIVYLLAPASRWVSRASLVVDAGLSLHVR
jgi:NAD(P)-dependent dehydrogenase (short-subunit alcohol dehydrogenase family)